MPSPACCLRCLLFNRGPTPCPSFHPIFRSICTPTDELQYTRVTGIAYAIHTVNFSRKWRGRGFYYLAGAMSVSRRVSPGMGAVSELMARALSPIWSGLPEAKSLVVMICCGAIPCSPRSCTTTDRPWWVLMLRIFILSNNTINMYLIVHEVLRSGRWPLRLLTAGWHERRRRPSYTKKGTLLIFIIIIIINTSHFYFDWPSLEPTVLKYPAEKPPVKAPWNLL